jgi:hypothetical protein
MGMEAPMKTEPSAEERRAAIAAFIAQHGVKRCPTACVVPTQAAIPAADRTALKDYALGREEARRAKALARLRALGLPASGEPVLPGSTRSMAPAREAAERKTPGRVRREPRGSAETGRCRRSAPPPP